MTINILYGWGKIVSRAINFLLIAAISAVVLSGCNKERDDDGKGTIPDDSKGYTLEVKFPSPGVPYTGGILSGEIKSYKTDGSTVKPAPWKVEGYSETGESGPFTSTPPAWLTGFPSNGNGVDNKTASETVSVTVSARSAVLTNPNPHTTALRGKSEVGSQAEPIDLSKVPMGKNPFFSIADGATASTYEGKPMNTANCYVVTRPGWYKLPVVYGNAFKNGSPNANAYTSSASGTGVLKKFIRHDGNAITKPWIKENGINLNTGVAELLWQDFPFLLQDIKLDNSGKGYIVFHVSRANIHEGNAVIALKENNAFDADIVWSWHIWVCGGNDLKSIKVKNNKVKSGRPGQDNFDFLSENLGSCYDSGESITYPESNVWIKISNGEKTSVFKINREAGSSSFTTSSKYNCTYYQWGRKDPMLPSDGTASNQNKVWFDKSGTSKNNLPTAKWESDGSASTANAEIANTIKNPQMFNTAAYMDNLYYNLWDTKCNETGGYNDITKARFKAVTKSVYDPCPPGFCLPPNGAFTGFTKSGNSSDSTSEFNVSGSFDKGWHFRTVLKGDSDPAINPIIFFPASGDRRNNDGVLYIVGDYGHVWSSVPYYTFSGCYMSFSSGYVNPLNYYNRSSGFVLRPVKEN